LEHFINKDIAEHEYCSHHHGLDIIEPLYVRVTSRKPRATSRKPQVTSHKPQATSHKFQEQFWNRGKIMRQMAIAYHHWDIRSTMATVVRTHT